MPTLIAIVNDGKDRFFHRFHCFPPRESKPQARSFKPTAENHNAKELRRAFSTITEKLR
jgi:hypothetical protein